MNASELAIGLDFTLGVLVANWKLFTERKEIYADQSCLSEVRDGERGGGVGDPGWAFVPGVRV